MYCGVLNSALVAFAALQHVPPADLVKNERGTFKIFARAVGFFVILKS
jgi:hypothetical protein